MMLGAWTIRLVGAATLSGDPTLHLSSYHMDDMTAESLLAWIFLNSLEALKSHCS